MEQCLIEFSIAGILTDDNKFSENCLRCVCSIFKYNCAPVHLIFQDQSLISHMLSLVMHSIANQISITTILSYSIKVLEFFHFFYDFLKSELFTYFVFYLLSRQKSIKRCYGTKEQFSH